MCIRLCALVLGAALVAVPAAAQAPTPAAAEYSQEAFVIEQSTLSFRFENDGTGRREVFARIKVQSDAGVQQWGQLVFGYNAATERMDIRFVRVLKAGGVVVTAPSDAVQELSSPIERIAPIYTDFRQKHVTVPSLRPGETLEFGLAVTVHTALASGHFWMEHDFRTPAVVLDDRLEVDVPASRAINLKTADGFTPQVTDVGDRRVYRWRSSQKNPSAQQQLALQEALKLQDDAPLRAAIRLSTFQSWDDVGRWYAGLERASRAPSPELRVKAQELIAGRTRNLEKLEALYDFVALNFRYVSISLGTGRYQPRSAADVLRDQYGDCKDKHTLLASLMESVGLQASTVLIPSAGTLDPDFPSPSQFDHVITRAEVDGQAVWLDVTTEVAPFRLLSPELRKKQALVVDKGLGRLEETPADPPSPNSQKWSIDGSLGDLGTLRARVSYVIRGDLEIPLRTVFRQTPSSRWKEVIESFEESGIGGQVGEWKVSDPAATKQPFSIEYEVTKVSFVDWTKKTVSLALPMSSFELPEPDDAAPKPVRFGSPERSEYRFRLELGPGYAARPPQSVSVTRDYADYRASYVMAGRTLTAERTMTTSVREIGSERARDFAAFRRIVESDAAQRISLDVPASSSPNAVATDLKTADLLRSGADALRNDNVPQALALLKRAVELEPKHPSAWSLLGSVYAITLDFTQAIDAFNKQIAINPFDDKAYSALGTIYATQGRHAAAEAAFKKQLEVNPLDSATQRLLASFYLDTKRFAEAIPLLERASSVAGDDASLHVSRGQAYLNVGRDEDALAAFDRAIELSPTATVRNNVAYHLAEKGIRLDRAQQYAEAAVTATSVESRNVTLTRITLREIANMGSLASYWDTLGWVLFARGDLARAERLLDAAWKLSERGVIGDHLAQVYEKQGRRDLAIRTYAAVSSAERAPAETRDRLKRLAAPQDAGALEDAHRSDLLAMRTVSLPRSGTAVAGSAEFFVLLGTQGVEDVVFVSGDAALREATTAIRAADFRALLPIDDVVPAKIVRRGGLVCTAAPAKPTCSFVVFPLSTTRPTSSSVNE